MFYAEIMMEINIIKYTSSNLGKIGSDKAWESFTNRINKIIAE